VWSLAIDRGIQSFDTADSYDDGGAERLLSYLLRGVPRNTYRLSSKCFFSTTLAPLGGLSQAHVKPALEASLKRLNTDYLDVYFAHRDDPSQSVEQIAQTFNHHLTEGLIRHWGICRWAPERVEKLFAFCTASGMQPPIAHQFHYNLFNREAENLAVPFFDRLALPTWVYSPLAQGVLSGKYMAGIPSAARASMSQAKATMWDLQPTKIARVAAWESWLMKRELTPVKAAISFCVRRSEVSHLLIGASRAEQLEEILSGANLEWQPEFAEVFDAM
jgi:aryl-alcohol dehydrogenase-like predicted oxidoreductase